MSNILNHIASSISHSTEDIATMGLCYILENSKPAKKAVLKLMLDRLSDTRDSDLCFTTQQTGDNRERPDMVATDTNGNEIFLFEMKFWAGLTDNQPNTYLDRLKKRGGRALIFICPNQRKISLVGEVSERAGYESAGDGNLLRLGDAPAILILSWEEVLDALAGVKDMAADIEQLSALVREQGAQTFAPFTHADLSPAMAERILSYYAIIDKVADTLIADKICSGKGLKAAPQRDGYTRYIVAENAPAGLGLLFSCEHWRKNSGDKTSPFWLRIKSTESAQYTTWSSGLKFRPKLTAANIEHFVDSDALVTPLYAETGISEDALIRKITEQVKSIVKTLS